jgi:chromate reductase
MLMRKENDMGEVIRIGGIAGSLRKGSSNRAALRAAVGLLPTDTVLDIFDLEAYPDLMRTMNHPSPVPRGLLRKRSKRQMRS